MRIKTNTIELSLYKTYYWIDLYSSPSDKNKAWYLKLKSSVECLKSQVYKDGTCEMIIYCENTMLCFYYENKNV